MTSAADWFIQDKLRRLASSASSAAMRVRGARTLRQVRDWGEVHVDSVVRSLSHSVPELRRLEAARRERASQLLDEQLKELQTVLNEQGLAAFDKRAAALRQQEWCFLRGSDYGNLYSHAETQATRMRREAQASKPPEPPVAP